MRILHLLSQHPESTGSGIYLRQVIRRVAAIGHSNGLVVGVSGEMTPKLMGYRPRIVNLCASVKSRSISPFPG